MEGPVQGILGRDAELAEVRSFIGSGSGGPSALLLDQRAVSVASLGVVRALTRIAGFDQRFRHIGIVPGDTVVADVGPAGP
jgi:hypothetical protein